MRLLRPALLLALLPAVLPTLLFTGCGGGEESPSDPPASAVATGQSSTANLGAAGGTVVLATGEGAQFSLELPAGALPEATAVRLSTLAPTGAQRFQLRLEPAGLVLADGKVASLTITLPAAMALPATGALAYDGVPVPAQRLADGRWRVALTAFAAGTDVAAGSDRVVALSARRLSTTRAPCGGAPGTAGFSPGTLTTSDTTPLETYGACMIDAVQALADEGNHAAAARLASATAAYLQAAGAQGASTAVLVAQAGRMACATLRARLDAADDAAAEEGVVQSATDVRFYGQPVLVWQKAVEQLGVVCTEVSPTEYIDTLRALVLRSTAWYQAQLKPRLAEADTSSPDYTAAVAALQGHRDAVREVRSLPASEGSQVDNTAREQIGEQAQNSLLQAVLQPPWRRCRDSGNFDRLIELMRLGDNPAAVKQAAQHCATQLNARALDAGGAVIATLDPPLGGVRAGEARTGGSLQVAKDGRLELSGPIRALQCPAGHAGGSEALEIRLGSTLLQTITAAPYLASTLSIDIAAALRAAGIDAASFTSATLTLTRTGSPCGGFWGDNPVPLLALELSGGVCAPSEGEAFCATLIEVPTDAAYSPKRLNAAGQVLYEIHDPTACQAADNPEHKPCGAIWHRGSLRTLPNRFVPLDMAEDGSVGGSQLEGSVYTTTKHDPAVVKAGAAASTVLANGIPQTGSDNLSGVSYLMKSFSLSGRATYVGVTGGYAYDQRDRGFCYTYPDLTYTLIYCWREAWYESAGPNYGSSTQIQSSQLPGASIYSWDVFMDGGAGGRIGYGHQFVPSEYFAMKDFIKGASLGESIGGGPAYPIAVDAAGRSLRQAGDGSTSLSADGDKLPAGTQASQLGPNGHAVACSTATDGGGERSFSLVNLTTGQATAPMSAYKSIQVGGDTIQLSVTCNASRNDSHRFIDAKGRLLVAASSETRPRVRSAILTPRGVALP